MTEDEMRVKVKKLVEEWYTNIVVINLLEKEDLDALESRIVALMKEHIIPDCTCRIVAEGIYLRRVADPNCRFHAEVPTVLPPSGPNVGG